MAKTGPSICIATATIAQVHIKFLEILQQMETGLRSFNPKGKISDRHHHTSSNNSSTYQEQPPLAWSLSVARIQIKEMAHHCFQRISLGESRNVCMENNNADRWRSLRRDWASGWTQQDQKFHQKQTWRPRGSISRRHNTGKTLGIETQVQMQMACWKQSSHQLRLDGHPKRHLTNKTAGHQQSSVNHQRHLPGTLTSNDNKKWIKATMIEKHLTTNKSQMHNWKMMSKT